MSIFARFATAFLLLSLFPLSESRAVYSQDQIVPPSGGKEVLSFKKNGGIKFRTSNLEANASWFDVDDMPFKMAYRITAEERFTKPKNATVGVPIKSTIQKGDVVLLSFWIRRPGAGGQPNNVYLNVNSGSDSLGFEYKLSAYRDWKQQVRSFVAATDYDTKTGSVSIDLGESGKVTEIAELRLINYGPDRDVDSLPRSTVNYKGRAADAKWRRDALARIENIRKADLNVTVVTPDGAPVEGATVKVEMQRHAFQFGNVVNAQLIGGKESSFPYTRSRSGTKKTSSWKDAQKYREVIKNNFNCVTFESELRPHVWKKQMGDSVDGKRLHKVFVEQAVPWLLSNNIAIRGHYVAWGAMDFNAIEKQFVGDPVAHRKWLWDHMADVLPKTADFVSEWDTINHIIAWGKHTYEAEYGGMQIYADIMKEARRLAPGSTHAINEGKVLPNGYKREPYKRVIRFLNQQGQSPDTVGFMAHFDLSTLTPPEELLQVYDDFAEIAPRLQLSEFDVEAGDDDRLQADYYRDVMIASFSHPNFVSIVQWGFWENAHWKPAAALWREDWTLKPAGQVYVDLVKNQWWTNEAATTGESGECSVRGFHGDYLVTVQHGGKTVTQKVDLEKSGASVRVTLK